MSHERATLTDVETSTANLDIHVDIDDHDLVDFRVENVDGDYYAAKVTREDIVALIEALSAVIE